MPFTGTYNKYGKANPGQHGVYDGRGYADWSTDLFAAEAVPVRARIYAPINGVSYVLKVQRTWSSACAGRGVYVGIYRNGSMVGVVSYAHLANVPAFTAGQTITTGTVLGYMKWWRGCTTNYDVRSTEGTHTHIEVGAVSGRACYLPFGAGARLSDTRMIGKIVPGTTASCS